MLSFGFGRKMQITAIVLGLAAWGALGKLGYKAFEQKILVPLGYNPNRANLPNKDLQPLTFPERSTLDHFNNQ